MSGYLFTLSFFILYAIFGLFPMFFSFCLSFFKWDCLTPMTYVGLDNFNFILNDSIFYSSIVNTFIIGILGTLPQLFFALLIAFALNSTMIRFSNTFRTLIFLSYITSLVSVTIFFWIIFNN